MVDEVFIIQESGLPLFHWSSDPEIDSSDDYILHSSFFQAISAFGKDMAGDEIKFVIFENKGYALQAIKKFGLKIIFGEFQSEIDLKNSEKDISTTTGFVTGFLTANYPNGINELVDDDVEHFNNEFSSHLKDQKIIPEPKVPKSRKEQRQRLQGFMFRTLGYKPGQCNIGPVERQKRLLTGLGFGLFAVISLVILIHLELYLGFPRILRLIILPFPLFMTFQGFYQYFFRFCVTNAFKRRYQMY